MSEGKLVLIIGPSGVGKSVILRALMKKHPEFVFPKSATTRPRRKGESDELYHFISDTEFDQWIKDGKFLEWAQVHKAARYGTLRSEIIPPIEAGKTVIREVDVQGFESIRKDTDFSSEKYTLFTIFILPESKEQLAERITKRAPLSNEELKRRIESMEEELKCAFLCNATIMNKEGDLEGTIAAVEEAI